LAVLAEEDAVEHAALVGAALQPAADPLEHVAGRRLGHPDLAEVVDGDAAGSDVLAEAAPMHAVYLPGERARDVELAVATAVEDDLGGAHQPAGLLGDG